MGRRSLSDQRHLLVELELDESVLADAAQLRPPSVRHHAPLPTSVRRPQSATLRRPTTATGDLKTPSPYKLKQKVLSSRSRTGLDDVDRTLRRPAPLTTGRRNNESLSLARPSMPSPLLLVAEAIRDNMSQRSRVLVEVQDELRRIPPLPRRGATSSPAALLSSAAIKMLNRLRSLTLSIVEMVRYFHEQLPVSATTSGDPVVWALRYEFEDAFARICASDVDCLLGFPPLVLFVESLGATALRNPFLDGVALDSSELLLCSCQSIGREVDGGGDVAATSLFQLVVSRLEAFALHVRRAYPSWQTLPHDRVARALLDLLESENRANASRLLPSYLRPKGSRGFCSPSASTLACCRYGAYESTGEVRGEDKESEVEEEAIVRPVAWAEPEAQHQKHDHLRQVTVKAATLSPRSQAAAGAPILAVGSPTPRVSTVAEPLPAVAEPKPVALSDGHKHAKKAKRQQEPSTTAVIAAPERNIECMNKALLCESDSKDEATHATTGSALEKLVHFPLEPLGPSTRSVVEASRSSAFGDCSHLATQEALAANPAADPKQQDSPSEPVAVAVAAWTHPIEQPERRPVLDPIAESSAIAPRLTEIVVISASAATAVGSVQAKQASADDQDEGHSSELSRIHTLCRDVHVAAIDLRDWLHHPPSGSVSSPCPTPTPPQLTLSTQFLERELKMLRRCFRLWVAALAQRLARLEVLRVACAARLIGRFASEALALKREALRRRSQRRHHRMALRIQQQWRTFQQRRQRQRAFHRQHTIFHRFRFFVRVEQRRRRQRQAAQTLQRWWRRLLRVKRDAQRRRVERDALAIRRVAAARHLQGFVREQLLRTQLAKALEANRRIHQMDALRVLKAKQDESKRRQREGKRLATVRAAMQLALGEMKTKWHLAEAEKRRICEQQAQLDAQHRRSTEANRRELARQRLDRFLELSVLRRRLHAATRANELVASAKRELERVRRRLERQQRAEHACRLLQGRMLWWKLAKTNETHRIDTNEREHANEIQRQQLRERDEAAQRVHAQLRAVVAQLRVSEYCGAAQIRAVEITYGCRLAAKYEEVQRLRRQAARERIAGFVQHWWTLARAEALAADQKQQQEAEAQRLYVREQHQVETDARERRQQSERLVADWVTSQVVRIRDRKLAETQRLAVEAELRAETQRRLLAEQNSERLRLEKDQLDRQSRRRRREQLAKLQHRKAQIRSRQVAQYHERVEQQKSDTLAAQRLQQQQLERVALVQLLMDAQKIADNVASSALLQALARHCDSCAGFELAAQFRGIYQRAWLREAYCRWRQFVARRRLITAISTHALWGSKHSSSQIVSLVHASARDSGAQLLAETQRRDLRLFELRCVMSARKIQRVWGAWRKTLRQRRRLVVKQSEDKLIARAKAPTLSRTKSEEEEDEVVAAAVQAATSTLVCWLGQLLDRQRRLGRFKVSDKTVIFFAGGRAWATSPPVAINVATTRLRCDRVVTRKLLRATDPTVSSQRDVAHLLGELRLDLQPLLLATAATISARPLELGDDVSEMELPRFCFATRQLSKTRSMVKRRQLLDAKGAALPEDELVVAASRSLSIFDAVETASVDDAQFLLLHGADLHAREPCHQRTALHMLAFSGSEPLAERLAMLRFLVERAKLDVHARDDNGDTPLLLFAAYGCVGLVNALLQVACSSVLWVETNHAGVNAFHRACGQDQPEVALLLQHKFVGTTTTTATAERDKTLLALHAPDTSGATPLHTLARRGHVECLRQLLAAVDASSQAKLLDQRDREGCAALHLAVAHGHVDLARALIEFGAHVSAGDEWHRRPLHYAIKVVNAVELLSLLAETVDLDLDRGLDLDAVDERGDTALHWAAASGRVHVVRHLLVLGADPNVLNSDWESPAQVAASRRHGECMRMLLPTTRALRVVKGDGHLLSPVRDPTQELASAKSYCHPAYGAAAVAQASDTHAPRRAGDFDWDEIHQGVQLVEESGHFSSEDEMHGGSEWSSSSSSSEEDGD